MLNLCTLFPGQPTDVPSDDEDRLSSLPELVLLTLFSYMDSLSIKNLSLTSKVTNSSFVKGFGHRQSLMIAAIWGITQAKQFSISLHSNIVCYYCKWKNYLDCLCH